MINFSVKVVNPVRKSEYVSRKVRCIPKYTAVDELKEKLGEELNLDIEEMGYISPGHGLKGKLNPLTSEDLDDIYAEYKRKRADIKLWYSTPSPHSKSDASTEKKRPKKRSLTFDEEDPPAPTIKKQTCAQKIKDVEAVVDVLTEKKNMALNIRLNN